MKSNYYINALIIIIGFAFLLVLCTGELYFKAKMIRQQQQLIENTDSINQRLKAYELSME